MWSPWLGDPLNNTEWSEGPMNGEGCDLSVPSPALAGYLGNVSWALFSPYCHMCKAIIKTFRLDHILDIKKFTQITHKIKEIFVKGESYGKSYKS